MGNKEVKEGMEIREGNKRKGQGRNIREKNKGWKQSEQQGDKEEYH